MERRRPRRPPTRPLVLLVDGHADTCELYATALRSFGFETTTVNDGATAFAQAWRVHPDIIVTELSVPGFSVWEFIRDVKRDPRTRDIPVVIVTTDGLGRAREQAAQEGCSAFLLKPCPPEVLAATLREVCNSTHARDHASSSH
jgi:two-component system, cell cycle response regulator DivK